MQKRRRRQQRARTPLFKVVPEFRTRHDDGRVFPTGRYSVRLPAFMPITKEEFPSLAKKMVAEPHLVPRVVSSDPYLGKTYLLLQNRALASQIKSFNPDEAYVADNSTIVLEYSPYRIEGGMVQRRPTILVDIPSANPEFMEKLSGAGFEVDEVHVHSIPPPGGRGEAMLVKHHHFDIQPEPVQLKKLMDILNSESAEVSKIRKR